MNIDSSFDSSGDLRLAESAANGDDQAFQELFGRFRTHLKRYVEMRMDARVQRRFDASDVVQETQIEAHRRLSDFLSRRPMPLKIWLRKLAHERLLDNQKMHLHRQKRSVRREVAVPDRSSQMLAGQFVDGRISPSNEVIREEHRKAVAKLINELDTSDRDILLMRFIEGLGFRDIGFSLGVSEGAASKRCWRALQRLRETIRQAGFGDSEC